MTNVTTAKIFQAIAQERFRQDDIWGFQDHEDGYWYAILGEEFGEIGTSLCDQFFGGKDLDKCGKDLETELIQTAAVCVAWLEALKRRNEETTPTS